MEKIDLKKKYAKLYKQSAKKATIVNIPPLNYLMVDGKGDPNTSQGYQEAIEALYAVSYTLKFMVKKEENVNYVVMPLEGLWWTEDMEGFSVDNKDEWKWTAMVMQPKYVTDQRLETARTQVEKKKNPPALSKVRFETLREGKAAQILHIGSYSSEVPTIAKLHAFIEENGYIPTKKHHEIYLSDPRRTAPKKLKTIIRQPVKNV